MRLLAVLVVILSTAFAEPPLISHLSYVPLSSHLLDYTTIHKPILRDFVPRIETTDIFKSAIPVSYFLEPPTIKEPLVPIVRELIPPLETTGIVKPLVPTGHIVEPVEKPVITLHRELVPPVEITDVKPVPEPVEVKPIKEPIVPIVRDIVPPVSEIVKPIVPTVFDTVHVQKPIFPIVRDFIPPVEPVENVNPSVPSTVVSSVPTLPIFEVPDIRTQYYIRDQLGQASYGHIEPGQRHHAFQDVYGNKIGGFSYFDAEGKVVQTGYIADKDGYRVVSNNLPIAPVPIQDTPEVAAAKLQHFAELEKAKVTA